MPIWVHRLLGIVVQAAGFFGGALAGMFVGCLCFMALAAARDAGAWKVLLGVGYVLVLVIAAACFFGGAWLARILLYGLFVSKVPARCRECGGRAYFEYEIGDDVRYGCRSCKHEYLGRSWQE